MRNIIIGNGINIEFGGANYCNKGILNRALMNLHIKEYASLFANKVTSREIEKIFYGLYDELKSLLQGNYDKYCLTDDEHYTLARFKRQYTLDSKIFELAWRITFSF